MYRVVVAFFFSTLPWQPTDAPWLADELERLQSLAEANGVRADLPISIIIDQTPCFFRVVIGPRSPKNSELVGLPSLVCGATGINLTIMGKHVVTFDNSYHMRYMCSLRSRLSLPWEEGEDEQLRAAVAVCTGSCIPTFSTILFKVVVFLPCSCVAPMIGSKSLPSWTAARLTSAIRGGGTQLDQALRKIRHSPSKKSENCFCWYAL